MTTLRRAGSDRALVGATDLVRDRLSRVRGRLRRRGLAVPAPAGKLLRPMLAYACVPPTQRAGLDDRFWHGALAVQMAHEASLLHDDILDGAEERRGEATLSASHGIGPALVLGDHYLTGAYRAALGTGSSDFVERFIVAVERTVAGEVRQASSAGRVLDVAAYDEIVAGKAGDLAGAATCLWAVLQGSSAVDELAGVGREIGSLYQRLDDLLDYCPAAETGKRPLQDYRQRKWTWILQVAGIDVFGLDERAVLEAVFGRAGGRSSAAERALEALRGRRTEIVSRARRLTGDGGLLESILDGWLAEAEAGVARQLVKGRHSPRGGSATAARSAEAFVVEQARAIGGPDGWRRYFGAHARTFSTAALLFPPNRRRSIEGVYAFCRFTDDLVDTPTDGADAETLVERLDVWREMTRDAFDHAGCGVELLDVVLGEARRSGVAWRYPDALLDGVGMDLRVRRYADWHELERYTFCVAGAVGGWVTQLFGLHDPMLLDRAHALGHAMQLTNILRDVGEDLDRGRVYLPATLLDRHGTSVEELRACLTGAGRLPSAWADAMEELVAVADAYYAWAEPGIRALPPFFRRPVAAAASAYRAIHDEVRANAYDNLRLRARTSLVTKVRAGGWGVLRAGAPRLSRRTSPLGLVT